MAAYDVFDAFLDGQRNRINVADVDAVARRGANFSGIAAEMRAGVFVWTAAALEQFMPEFITESMDTISARGLLATDLRFSLFASFCETHFHTVRSADVRNAWRSRIAILEALEAADPVTMDAGPMDGRTVRAYHFEVLWALYGLPGSPWPLPVHRQVLEDLANSRNDVAHGAVSPVVFGRGRTFQDCRRMLDRMDELVLHVVLAMDSYLHTDHGYRR